jgi:N-acetylglucosaminyldiphosphoundecaprenol N-acetyl-beta-D-mannosaminyltransferase
MEQAVMKTCAAIENRSKGYICVTGVHGIMESQKDSSLKRILNAAMLNLPDGQPTVWVGRWQGFSTMRRVFGPDFMLRLASISAARGYTHFLYGGAPGVADQLKQELVQRFPGLRVVGTYTPPFRRLSDAEERDLQVLVAQVRPDVFWVGLSTPKQEKFMAEHFHVLDSTVMVGVGAAFDLHTHRIQDAPAWMKQAGLQWLHRLRQEPRRLWKRYLINNPKFIYQIGLQLLGARKYEL